MLAMIPAWATLLAFATQTGKQLGEPLRPILLDIERQGKRQIGSNSSVVFSGG